MAVPDGKPISQLPVPADHLMQLRKTNAQRKFNVIGRCCCKLCLAWNCRMGNAAGKQQGEVGGGRKEARNVSSSQQLMQLASSAAAVDGVAGRGLPHFSSQQGRGSSIIQLRGGAAGRLIAFLGPEDAAALLCVAKGGRSEARESDTPTAAAGVGLARLSVTRSPASLPLVADAATPYDPVASADLLLLILPLAKKRALHLLGIAKPVTVARPPFDDEEADVTSGGTSHAKPVGKHHAKAVALIRSPIRHLSTGSISLSGLLTPLLHAASSSPASCSGSGNTAASPSPCHSSSAVSASGVVEGIRSFSDATVTSTTTAEASSSLRHQHHNSQSMLNGTPQHRHHRNASSQAVVAECDPAVTRTHVNPPPSSSTSCLDAYPSIRLDSLCYRARGPTSWLQVLRDAHSLHAMAEETRIRDGNGNMSAPSSQSGTPSQSLSSSILQPASVLFVIMTRCATAEAVLLRRHFPYFSL